MLPNLLKRTSHVSRWPAAVAVCAAVVLAGCGTTTTAPPATAPTTATGPQFDQGLVPAPQKNIPVVPKPKATNGTKGTKSKSKPATKPAAPASTPAPATVTVNKTKTITITHVVTVVHHELPDVPSGAQLPSTQPARSLTRFSSPGGNVGCELSSGEARCDIASRVWRPPNRPNSCGVAWGQGMFVSGKTAGFVCAGDSVLDPTGTVIPDGYDDRVGSFTCQIRMFGVTCFDTDGAGFSISRTGYTIF